MMNDIEIDLKGGVIIIGSLYWQDDLNDNDSLRKKWRENYLDIQNKVLTKLPIRYGRYSKSEIYTMVFSMICEKRKTLGTGYIVPFKMNPIKNIKTIISVAESMSEAEGMSKKFIGGNQQTWSSMAIIFNDNKISEKVKNIILKEWHEKHIKDGGGNDCKDYRFGCEKRCISTKGELQIKWPLPFGSEDYEKINELDFLIATVTKPKHKSKKKKYPSISEIANTVTNDSSRKYFKNNFFHNIVTFQDN